MAFDCVFFIAFMNKLAPAGLFKLDIKTATAKRKRKKEKEKKTLQPHSQTIKLMYTLQGKHDVSKTDG